MEWLKSFRNLNIPPGRYLTQYVLPLFLAGLFLAFMAAQLLAGVDPRIRGLVMVAAPAFSLWLAFLVPQIIGDRSRRDIDNNIHFYITHMGALASANLPPVDILAKLGEKEDYGALAEASAEIASLVRSWNMGLPEACRFVADRTQSLIYADFLERFAYALETGEDLLSFLKNEQAVVMGDYATQYQANLYGVDSVKDMYMSTMMSVIFLVIFGLISPILTGVDPGALIWLVAGMILLLEFIFLMLLVMRAPNDALWTASPERVGPRRRLDHYLPLAVGLSALTWAATVVAFDLDAPYVVALACTPLLILGIAATKIESEIRRKDDNFPAFIRSLGASTSARGGSPKEVLKRLRRHDFGPLTDDVEALYRRLNLRLDDDRAWTRFAHESSSNIIDRFTAMFVEGINAGGDAAEIGRIVSDNVVRIIALRKHRVQSAVSFRGMMIGMTAGMAGTLYIGVGLLKVLSDLFVGAEMPDDAMDVGLSLGEFSVDVPMLMMLVTGIMVLHNLLGSYMVTTASGGNTYRVAAYLPLLAWVTALAAFGAKAALGTFE